MAWNRWWTPDEELFLLRMRKQGLKAAYIARKLKRSEMGVYDKLGEMKEASPKKRWQPWQWKTAVRMLDEGYTYKQIGERIGKSRDTVKQKFYEERKRGRL